MIQEVDVIPTPACKADYTKACNKLMVPISAT